MKTSRCQRVRPMMQKMTRLMFISDKKIYNTNNNFKILHAYARHSMKVRVDGTCYALNFQHEQRTTMYFLYDNNIIESNDVQCHHWKQTMIKIKLPSMLIFFHTTSSTANSITIMKYHNNNESMTPIFFSFIIIKASNNMSSK